MQTDPTLNLIGAPPGYTPSTPAQLVPTMPAYRPGYITPQLGGGPLINLQPPPTAPTPGYQTPNLGLIKGDPGYTGDAPYNAKDAMNAAIYKLPIPTYARQFWPYTGGQTMDPDWHPYGLHEQVYAPPATLYTNQDAADYLAQRVNPYRDFARNLVKSGAINSVLTPDPSHSWTDIHRAMVRLGYGDIDPQPLPSADEYRGTEQARPGPNALYYPKTGESATPPRGIVTDAYQTPQYILHEMAHAAHARHQGGDVNGPLTDIVTPAEQRSFQGRSIGRYQIPFTRNPWTDVVRANNGYDLSDPAFQHEIPSTLAEFGASLENPGYSQDVNRYPREPALSYLQGRVPDSQYYTNIYKPESAKTVTPQMAQFALTILHRLLGVADQDAQQGMLTPPPPWLSP